jgi:CheY-like chemotaxis protein
LYDVMNLSNYSLYLIQDIIQYVSEETRKNVSLDKVKIKENLKFCYDVLQTLIECNENKSNKIRTSFQCDEEIENLTILSDEIKLKQIFLNLISNSIKFTVSGTIRLLASFDFITNALIISVEDTGIGIKEEDFQYIFQENIQLNLDKDYNSKGSGLGLAISKQLAVSLNYEMDFQSKLGIGTKFNLRIPLTNCLNQTYDKVLEESVNKTIKFNHSHNFPLIRTSIVNNYKIPAKQNSSTSLSMKYSKIFNSRFSEKNSSNQNVNGGRKDNLIELNTELSLFSYNFTITGLNYSSSKLCIVVVDDYKLVRVNTINLIKSSLKSLDVPDYSILEGSDGIDLLNIVRNDVDGKIKCIFTDENMEYLNGSEAVKIIRKLEQNNKIKSQFIVSITAFDDVGTRSNITESGVNNILSKPCTKTKITDILRDILINLN